MNIGSEAGKIQAGDLGMGCWAIGGTDWGPVDDAESVRAIHAALEAGIRYFDTADVYGQGHSETVLGKALAGRPEATVVSTKTGGGYGNLFDGYSSSKDIVQATENALAGSRKRLVQERLPFVFFHVNDADPELAKPVFDVLSAQKEVGLVGSFGWSTDYPESAAQYSGLNGFEAVQFDMNLFKPADAMNRLLKEKNLTAVLRQPLAMGLLARSSDGWSNGFTENDIRLRAPAWLVWFQDGKPNPELVGKLDEVRELLMTGGRTLAQGALAWLWARSPDAVPIPGFRTVAQVQENALAREKGPLTKTVMSEIAGIMNSPD